MKNIGSLQISEFTTSDVPATPDVGYLKLYLRDNAWYALDSTGTETKITADTGAILINTSNITNDLLANILHELKKLNTYMAEGFDEEIHYED